MIKRTRMRRVIEKNRMRRRMMILMERKEMMVVERKEMVGEVKPSAAGVVGEGEDDASLEEERWL